MFNPFTDDIYSVASLLKVSYRIPKKPLELILCSSRSSTSESFQSLCSDSLCKIVYNTARIWVGT